MTRAQRRREEKAMRKSEKKITKQYDPELVRQVREGAVGEALMIMLCFPLKVLKDNYWKKTAPQWLGVFTEQVLDLYEQYLNGPVDIEALKDDLWTYGGMKLVKVE